MLSAATAAGVEIRAPAKVNLFLEVLGKRPDGYHEIATLMAAVSLYDVLEFRDDASGQVHLTCNDPALDTGPSNLVCKSAAVLRRHTGTTLGAAVHLTKRIPMAAGLAGGSSDAAATLAGLNQLWRLGLTNGELAVLAAEIGSDVAFFFHTPLAWATGRGEVVTAQPLGRPLDLLIVAPGVGLSTADVYRQVTPPATPQSGAAIRAAAAAGDVEAIGRALHNRLQAPAEQLCPTVAAWQQRLAGLGAAGAMMSGSGSSLFALCRDRHEAVRLAREVRKEARDTDGRLFLVRSCV